MRKDIEPINRMALADIISKEHDVDGRQIVANVAHIGDKDNQHILSKMGLRGRHKRIRAIHALGHARRELGVWPQEPEE